MSEVKKKQQDVVIEQVRRGGENIAGQLKMSADVVATIAALAARQIEGVHSLGRSSLISFAKKKTTRGVAAEVGNREAALDLEVIVEYGCNLREVASQLRRRVADEVDRMAGRKVVEVNINVVGVHLPEPDGEPEAPTRPPTAPRVR